MRTVREAIGAIQRMKEIANVETDKELADTLRVSKNTISSWKKRNAIPLEKCISFSQIFMCSLDSIIFEGETDITPSIYETNVSAYAVSIYFYEHTRTYFQHGDRQTTAWWWGRLFQWLLQYYEHELFSLEEQSGVSSEQAAFELMRHIDQINAAEAVELLDQKAAPR